MILLIILLLIWHLTAAICSRKSQEVHHSATDVENSWISMQGKSLDNSWTLPGFPHHDITNSGSKKNQMDSPEKLPSYSWIHWISSRNFSITTFSFESCVNLPFLHYASSPKSRDITEAGPNTIFLLFYPRNCCIGTICARGRPANINGVVFFTN